MSALTSARSTRRMISSESPLIHGLSVPVKASTKCIQGGIAVIDAGFAAPGRTAIGLVALGIFQDTADNSAGIAGAINARVRRGVFPFVNSSAGDAIAQANVGQLCYMVDDQTVALTDGNATRSIAGVVLQVDSFGVWVEIGAIPVAPANPRSILSIPIDFATLANAQAYALTPGFPGRILGISVSVRKPATTAAKLATIQAQVAAVSCTGGAVALTSANMTPAGANVAGTAITAGNSFTAAQSIGFTVSGVTAFVEGDGEVLVVLG